MNNFTYQQARLRICQPLKSWIGFGYMLASPVGLFWPHIYSTPGGHQQKHTLFSYTLGGVDFQFMEVVNWFLTCSPPEMGRMYRAVLVSIAEILQPGYMWFVHRPYWDFMTGIFWDKPGLEETGWKGTIGERQEWWGWGQAGRGGAWQLEQDGTGWEKSGCLGSTLRYQNIPLRGPKGGDGKTWWRKLKMKYLNRKWTFMTILWLFEHFRKCHVFLST